MARVLVPLPDRDFDPTEVAVPEYMDRAAYLSAFWKLGKYDRQHHRGAGAEEQDLAPS